MDSNEEVTEENKVKEIIDKAVEYLDVPEISHQPITRFKKSLITRHELDMPLTIEEYGALRNLLMINLNTYTSFESYLPLDYWSLTNASYEKVESYHDMAFEIIGCFAKATDHFKG